MPSRSNQQGNRTNPSRPATIPISRLPRLKLLDPVCDSRRPGIMGTFQRWMVGSCGTCAVVKFPGGRARLVCWRNVRRASPTFLRRAKLNQMRRRHERFAHLPPDDIRRVAAQFGLTVKQYREAIA